MNKYPIDTPRQNGQCSNHILEDTLDPLANKAECQTTKNNSMIIFLRRIPSNTLASELHDFISPALKGGIFSLSGRRILKAGILVMRNDHTESYEFHGYFHVESRKSGLQAVKNLNGELFKGRSIIVREYMQRTWQNDHRINNESPPHKAWEKRFIDRRRGNVMVVCENVITISAVDINECKLMDNQQTNN